MILLLLLLLAGCMVGPDYKAPENTVTTNWNAEDASITREKPVTDWWSAFNDPLLSKYIEKAAHHNNNILYAEANIQLARAARMIVASQLFPHVNANVNATKTYFSKNGPVFAGSSLTQGPSPATGLPLTIQAPQVQNLFDALFDATWEIDLFGKTRRAVQAAEAIAEGAIDQRNDALITAIAEIGRNYIELRMSQAQKELLEENVALLEESAALIKVRYERGYSSKLDLENSLAALASAQASLPEVHSQIYRSIYAISLLTGDLPETLIDELMPSKLLPEIPERIAVGLRSDLLRRRPDVRKAERELAAATAGIGVAIASFYPSISLTADGGYQSLKLRELFQGASKTWDIGGDILLPIFQGGRLVGNLKASRALAQAAHYTYQQVVLSAVTDAESSLVTLIQDQKQVEDLAETVVRDQTLVNLTSDQFQKGLITKLDLITAEQNLNTAEQSFLQSEGTALIDLIALYKSLGGGWEPCE